MTSKYQVYNKTITPSEFLLQEKVKYNMHRDGTYNGVVYSRYWLA
ncbi:MAG: hypothetical protein ABFD82_20820 [Syntrophaceae bacterium]